MTEELKRHGFRVALPPSSRPDDAISATDLSSTVLVFEFEPAESVGEGFERAQCRWVIGPQRSTSDIEDVPA